MLHFKLYLFLLRHACNPIQALIQSIASACTTSLNSPFSVFVGLQVELLSNLSGAQSSRHILLICIDKKSCVSKLLCLHKAFQFESCSIHSLLITGIDDENKTVRMGVIVPPEVSYFLLSSSRSTGGCVLNLGYNDAISHRYMQSLTHQHPTL